MKKYISLFLVLAILLLTPGCTEEKNDISDYQYMYGGIFEDWCKHTTPREGQDSLLEYGEYRYNSELLLFPRETPSTLKEFYMHWTRLMDFDGFSIYFTCQLDQRNYDGFVDGLKNFSYNSIGSKLPCDTENFDYPTYILQFTRWYGIDVFEYIMLDEENLTAIFVYTMDELEYIEENSEYTVTPKDIDALRGGHFLYPLNKDFDYDISFLNYLL